MLFADGDEQKHLFVCDREGIYSYVQGGNVMEQIVDASLNTMGNTSKGYVGFAKGKDHVFYVAKYGAEDSGGYAYTELYRYFYNPDVPTVPDQEVRVYMLGEYPELCQAALFYQKAHPETRISIESPLDSTENLPEDELNQNRMDKLKTLNTEILAGKGPDILVLDEMPVEAYIEKGILKDISHILKDEKAEDGVLRNIVETYTRNGMFIVQTSQ